jgi:predicted AlkP superfamily phosphohydrolase/phosphomutase
MAGRVVVLGLDGATWDFLDGLIAHGLLPSLAGFRRRGAYGRLVSAVPPCTPIGWKAYSTGRNPGEFGVFYWFSLTELRRGRIRLHDARAYKQPELWDFLTDAGYRCAVLGMPMTYPVKPINGVMVSGIPALETQPFTHPPVLAAELLRRGFRINPSTPLRLEPGTSRREAVATYRAAIEELNRLTSLYFSLVREWLGEDFRFIHATIQWTDQMLHYTWTLLNDHDPDLSDAIRGFWSHLDRCIGETLAAVGPDDYVFFISDHGMSPIKRFFHFNNWLERRGFLVSRRPPASIAARLAVRLGLSREGAYTLSQTPVGRAAVRLIPASVLRAVWFRLRTRSGRISSVETVNRVDWTRSKAVMVGDGYIYVNAPRSSARYEPLRREIMAAVNAAADPETGEPVCECLRVEDVYRGSHIEEFDLVVLPRPGYSLLVPSVEDDVEWTSSFDDHFTADHELHGILACAGPGIRRGAEVGPARIVDIMPTILSLLGIEPPAALDGRILRELFSGGFRAAAGRPMQPPEVARVRRRIRELKSKGVV